MSGNQISQTSSQPPPVGGMNAIQSLASMPPEDAVSLVNLFPTQYGVQVRGGSIDWAVMPTPDTVNAMMVYAGTNAKLYAASGSVVYDITSHTPVSIVTGLGSSDFIFINFVNTAGNWMCAVNGINDPILTDNTATIRRLVAGNGTTPYTINNVNPKLFSFVNSHARRLWFVEKNTTNGWYLLPNAVYGDAFKFDFGPVFKRGGELLLITTWTVDAGTGMNDKLVAISNRGEAALYSGDDPGDITNWVFEGVFFIGTPLSARCATPYGAELLVCTDQGLVSFSSVIVSNVLNPMQNLISDKVQLLISRLTTEFGQYYGWSVRINYVANEIIINVPGASVADAERPNVGGSPRINSPTNTSIQLIMNMVTGAWSIYADLNVVAMVPWTGGQVFSVGNKVKQWNFGNLDNVAQNGTGGVPIEFKALQAFSYSGSPGQLKHVKMARPTFLTDNALSYGIQIETDFSFKPFSAQIINIGTTSSLWGSAIWGANKWATSPGTVVRSWINCPALGFTLAINVKGSAYGATTWASTDLIAEVGGPI